MLFRSLRRDERDRCRAPNGAGLCIRLRPHGLRRTSPSRRRGWSTERRVQPPAGLSTKRAAPLLLKAGASPSEAPPRLFRPRRPCFRMGDPEGFWLLRSGRLPPPFVTRRVQPLRAVGHNADGRLAGASRRRGYEPRPRAPHPIPLSERLMTTPLGGSDPHRNTWAIIPQLTDA